MNKVVKGVLLTAAVASVGTGAYFSYKKISDQNAKISILQNENAEKDNEIKSLSNELNNKQKEIETLTTKLRIANENLEILQARVNSLELDIQSRDESITTLSRQKKTLLTAVTEIDTKVTQSTNTVEIETLQTRKTIILSQIDELNNEIIELSNEKQILQDEINVLKAEKTRLENEIEALKLEKQQLEDEIVKLKSTIGTLEASTGYEYIITSEILYTPLSTSVNGLRLYTFKRVNSVISLSDILSGKGLVPHSSLYVTEYSDWDRMSKSSAKYFIENFSKLEHVSNEVCEVYKYSLKDTWGYIEYSLTHSNFNSEQSKFSYSFDECEFEFFYNGVQYDCSELIFDDDSNSYVATYCIKNDKTISFYFLDLEVFTGKYVGPNNSYIDFDNKIISFGDSSINYSYYNIGNSNYSYGDVNVLGLSIWFYYFNETNDRYFKTWNFELDSSTGNLVIGGETFTKVVESTRES